MAFESAGIFKSIYNYSTRAYVYMYFQQNIQEK